MTLSEPRFPIAGRLVFLAALLLFLLPPPAFAARWYVDAGGEGSGTSWEDASPDLAYILKNAGPGDEIWVAGGDYRPFYDKDGKQVKDERRTFALKNGMKLFGGFPPGGAPGLGGRDPKTFPSVMTGDGAYHVVYAHSLDAGAELDGFTVTGGKAAVSSGNNSWGGGLYCYSTPLRLENCVFHGNSASKGGGGVHAVNSKLLLSRCSFLNNSSAGGLGGGILAENSEAVVEDCLFEGNRIDGSSGAAGGGVAFNKAMPVVIRNSSFINNRVGSKSSAVSGGALHIEGGSSIEIQNCTFSGNSAWAEGSAQGRGGAVSVKGNNSLLAMANCTLSGNDSKNHGSSAYIQSGSLWAVNCIFFDNTAAKELKCEPGGIAGILYSILPSYEAAAGDITLLNIITGDPNLGELRLNGGFAPTMAPSAEGAAADSGVGPEFPLIDAPVSVPPTDQRGKPRPSGGGTDLGAHELQLYKLSLSAAGNGSGIIETVPAGGEFLEDSIVTAAAVPDESSEFAGWAGDVSGENSPATVIMDGDKAGTAVFTLKRFEITASAGDGGAVTLSPLSTVEWGGTVEVHITPDSGYSISEVIIDGVPAGPVESHTFSDVRTSHSICAFFSLSGGGDPDGPGGPGGPDGPGGPGDPDGPDGPGDPDDPDGPGDPGGPDGPGGPGDPDDPDSKEYSNLYGRVIIRKESPALDHALSEETPVRFPEGLSESSFRRIAPKEINTVSLEPCPSPRGVYGHQPHSPRLTGVSFDIEAGLQNLTGIIASDIEIYVPVESLSSCCLAEIEKDREVMSPEEAFLRHVNIALSFAGEDSVLNGPDSSDLLDHFSVVQGEDSFFVTIRLILADASRGDMYAVQPVCAGADCRFFVFDGVSDGHFKGLIILLEREGPPASRTPKGGCSFSALPGLALLIGLPALLLAVRRP